MDDDSLYRLFKSAIDKEYESSQFYRDAAAVVEIAEAKALFLKIAETESYHKAELERLYKILKNAHNISRHTSVSIKNDVNSS